MYVSTYIYTVTFIKKQQIKRVLSPYIQSDIFQKEKVTSLNYLTYSERQRSKHFKLVKFMDKIFLLVKN
jgi:hypothetical protein